MFRGIPLLATSLCRGAAPARRRFGAGARSTPPFQATRVAPTPTDAAEPPEHDAQWRVFRCSQFHNSSRRRWVLF
jgi:hypothetical protein